MDIATMEEADALVDEYKAEVAAIQDQLHFRTKPRKARLEVLKKHYKWRKSAVGALRWKQTQLAEVKRWRCDYYKEHERKLCEDQSVVGLLYKSYRFNKRMLGMAWSKPDEEEQEMLDTIQVYLRSVELGDVNEHEAKKDQ